MKKIMLVAALATVSACSETAPAPEAEATEEVAAAPAENLAADGQPAPGMYRITTADGQVFNEEVKADGTYVQTDAEGQVVESGRWEQKSPEQYCYVVDEQYREDGDTGEQRCNTEGVGADGKWTSTNPDGETATVERVTA